ncbi:MAG: hypothetical protein J7527_01220 [Chitinophagaceae bacterium]|nr:hypothetical protein [Chitinophagaceae bacterium]
MLTPTLQTIVNQIRRSSPDRYETKSLSGDKGSHAELLNVLEQMDLFEAELSKAFEEGGLPAVSRVIVRPSQPNCQVCGRTIIDSNS